MTDDLPALLAAAPATAPRWMLPGRHQPRTPPDECAAALARLDEVDRRILVLVHGLGLSVGAVAAVLKLDPAIVSWRLRRSLGAAEDPAEFEASVAQLLRTPGAWLARELALGFPDEVKERLRAHFTHGVDELTLAERRPGLGVGAIALVGLAALGFMAYGVIRDENPLWRGQKHMRNGSYEQARSIFEEYARYSGSAEARVHVVLCFLASGDFDGALAYMRDPSVTQALGSFRPYENALTPVEVDPECGALLPRGHIAYVKPRFVYAPSPEGKLALLLLPPEGGADRIRVHEWPLPDTRDLSPVVVVDYPAEWPALPPGAALWGVPGSLAYKAPFTVLESELRAEILDRCQEVLPSGPVPEAARTYLRGHFYLRNQLYQQAAEQFAWLVEAFPDEPHPRELLAQVCAALQVDPQVVLALP